MNKQAKLREVLRLHREQRVSSQSAHRDSPTVLSPSSFPPRPVNGLFSTTAVQALSPLAPALKEPPLDISDATFSTRPEPETAAKKRKRATSVSPQISASIDKDDNRRDSLEDTSSDLDMCDGGIEVEDSEEERERQALWAVYSSRYAEMVGPEAKQSSNETASSASRKRLTASTASQGFPTTKKPSEAANTGKGGPADPIEIESPSTQ